MGFSSAFKGLTFKQRNATSDDIAANIVFKKTGSTISKEWTAPDLQITPSTTSLEEEEIVDAPGNDGNASMPEQFKRPNPWSKKMMRMFYKNFSTLLVIRGKNMTGALKERRLHAFYPEHKTLFV